MAKPDGAETNVVVIGFNPDSGAGGPWDLIAGAREDLKIADTIIIDDFYRADLGVRAPGELVEINNRRARVVGLTQGIRSFTTTPFVFTSFKNALNYETFAAGSGVASSGAGNRETLAEVDRPEGVGLEVVSSSKRAARRQRHESCRRVSIQANG